MSRFGYRTRLGLIYDDILTNVFDIDAQAFINAAGITDLTQQYAINDLVLGLKSDGLWTKMKAIYPFVGGTATSHKFNLKNPLDSDAAFRLVFTGGWTHSSTGATPNGTNAFADTKIVNNINIIDKQSHFSAYLRTVNISNGWFGYYNGSSVFGLQQYASATTIGVGVNNLSTYVATPTFGYYLGSTNITTGNIYKNGTLVYNVTGINTVVQNLNFYFGALNSLGSAVFFTTHQYAFGSLGDSFVASEALSYYNRVQTFQTALGRQV